MNEDITPLGWATRTEYAVVHWSTKDDAQAFHETYPNRVSAPEAMYAEVDVAALTARVKELEEENGCLRETLNRILSLAPDFTSPEVFYHAARDMALAALNKEPT